MSKAEFRQAAGIRLHALDLLRGLTVMLMLLVNMPGNSDHVYAQLDHAAWHGLTLTDLVFPFFLFIVGVSVPLAIDGKRRKNLARTAILTDGARRTLLLIGMGVAINLLFRPTLDLEQVRWAGVLQRIALVYAGCVLACMFLGLRLLLCLSGIVLLAYGWLLLRMPMTPEQTYVFVLDRALMPGRLLHGSWDPEGLLSTAPALVSGLLGVCTGQFLQMHGLTKRLATAGGLLLVSGAVLAFLIPLNKNLWTPSYVLFTAGLAVICLYLLAGARDGRTAQSWEVLPLAFGRNAIAAYLIHTLLIAMVIRKKFTGGQVNVWLYDRLVQLMPTPEFASAMCALIYLGLCAIPIVWLYRRRLYWNL